MKSMLFAKCCLPSRVVRGFTLIELLVVLAIIAVVLVVATPNFSGVMVESRLDKERLSLATGIALARSEAIQRSTNVRMCPWGSNGCGGAETVTNFEWTQGWRVEDTSKAGAERLLRRADKETSSVKVIYSCSAFLAFSASGERSSSSAHPGECTFTLYDTSDPSITRSLAVARSGRVRQF